MSKIRFKGIGAGNGFTGKKQFGLPIGKAN